MSYKTEFLKDDGEYNWAAIQQLPEDQIERAVGHAASVREYNKTLESKERGAVNKATPAKDVLFYHTEEQHGLKWIICWLCHAGGNYDRKAAASTHKFTGRLRSNPADPLQCLRNHRSAKHGKALTFPYLIDMTAEVEARKAERSSVDLPASMSSKLQAKLEQSRLEYRQAEAERLARQQRPETDKEKIRRLEAELRAVTNTPAETEASVAMPAPVEGSESQGAESKPAEGEASAGHSA